jgi:transcription elongation factor GreB
MADGADVVSSCKPRNMAGWHASRYNDGMNKAFVKESDDDEDLEGVLPQIPAGAKNYITPAGYQRIREELLQLIDVERPEVVRVVHWAASNGDRSENGDYLYGKKRLREIDRRIRFLTKRLDMAEIVDPSLHHGNDHVFFGATVTYENQHGQRQTVTIVGIDEIDPLNGKISWISPVARALTKAREGDAVILNTPGGMEELVICEVQYPSPGTTP